MRNNRYLNTLQLYWLFTNEDIAFDFAIENNMVYRTMTCCNCGAQTYLYQDRYRKFGYYFKCSNCNRYHSIFYLSVFYNAKIPMNMIFHLIYCWVHKYHCYHAAFEVGVSNATVSFYYKMFRNACFSYLLNLEDVQIGGPGKVVEIDETLMCRRKYQRGRILNDVWIFGGICREDNNVFAIVVKNRNADTLWSEIIKHIAPGTIIMSDSWGAYICIEMNGKKDFIHMSVNHSQNFIDPITGANTQRVERLWKELKRINKRYEGIPRDQVQSHLAEFIWRRNNINYNDPFLKAVELIANTTFE